MDPISRLHQSPINHAHEGRGQGGTPGLADDSRQWLGSPPAALCCRPRPLALLYNMWVFILLFLHHPPSTTLASRRTAVRFGRLVVDGPPPLGPSTTPSTMRSRRPDEGRATSTSRPPPALQPLGKTAAAQVMELTHVSPSRWRYLRPVGAPRRWSLHALDA